MALSTFWHPAITADSAGTIRNHRNPCAPLANCLPFSAIRRSLVRAAGYAAHNSSVAYKNTFQEPSMNATTTRPTKTRSFFVVLLVGTLLLAALSALLAYLGAQGELGGTLWMGEADMSDSMAAWFIAIPIVVFVLGITLVILGVVGIITAVCVAVSLILALVAVFVALVLAIMPLLIFLAVPILVIYGLVKLVSRDTKPRVEVITLPAPTNNV
jgi:hypothetical protein